MADEPVTQKQLQALEKKFNNQIAALKKEIADKHTAALKDTEQVEAAMVKGNQGHIQTFREIEPKITELQNSTKELQSASKDYGKRIGSLEQQSRMTK